MVKMLKNTKKIKLFQNSSVFIISVFHNISQTSEIFFVILLTRTLLTTEKEIKEITDNQGKYFFKEKMTLPYLFVNNYERSETEKLTAIKY